MQSTQRLLHESPDHLVVDTVGLNWRAVFDRPVNLYLWVRPAEFTDLLNTWIPQASVAVDFTISGSGDARRGLAEELAHWPGAEHPDFAGWMSDMALLAERYRALVNRATVRLRLETIIDDDCALFHVDQHTVRLLCTYAGPGTHWLPDAVVDRDQLGLQGRSVTAANNAIGPSSSIQEIPAGTVALLRGEGEPGREGRGIVHRSHPLRTRKWRVRLTLDAVSRDAG